MDHHHQHFNAPACANKANAECLECGVLRCYKHIHMNLSGMYKSLCNYCYHVDTYSAQALCLSRVTASLQPYTQEQLQNIFDRRSYPRTTIRKAVDMFATATTLPSFTQITCAFLDIYAALSSSRYPPRWQQKRNAFSITQTSTDLTETQGSNSHGVPLQYVPRYA